GGYPYSTPVFDGAGNLYGTTLNGGNTSNGVVFELSPPSGGRKQWTKQSCTASTMPMTVSNHGWASSGFCRQFVRLDPERRQHRLWRGLSTQPADRRQPGWTETILHNFGFSPDGGSPGYSKLAMDGGGNLFGTSQVGGTLHNGVVFKIAPPAKRDGAWTESVLHTFEGSPDGSQPEAGLTLGADGLLYGTTFFGGTTNDSGTVFQVTPQVTPHC